MVINDDVIICKVVRKDSKLGSYNGAASSKLNGARIVTNVTNSTTKSNIAASSSVTSAHERNSQSVQAIMPSPSGAHIATITTPLLSTPLTILSKPPIQLSYVAGPLSVIEEVDDSMIRDSLQSTMNSKSSTSRYNLSATIHSSPTKSSFAVISGMNDTLLRSYAQGGFVINDSMEEESLVDSLEAGSNILRSMTNDAKRSIDPLRDNNDDLEDSLTLTSRRNVDSRHDDDVAMGTEDRPSIDSRRIEIFTYANSSPKYRSNRPVTEPLSTEHRDIVPIGSIIPTNNGNNKPPRSPETKRTTASIISINHSNRSQQQPSIPTKQDLLSVSPIRPVISDVSSSIITDGLSTRSPIQSQLRVVQELYEANIRDRLHPVIEQQQPPPSLLQRQQQQELLRQHQHQQQQLLKQQKQHPQIPQPQVHQNQPPQTQAMKIVPHRLRHQLQSLPQSHQQQQHQQQQQQQQQQHQIHPSLPPQMQYSEPPRLLQQDVNTYESNFVNNRKKTDASVHQNLSNAKDISDRYIPRSNNMHHQHQQQEKDLNKVVSPPLQPNKMIALHRVQSNDNHPGPTSSGSNVFAKNKHRIPGIDRAMIQDLQEKKLLDEIEELNRIQLQRLKELSVIERQDKQSISKQTSNNDNDKRVLDKKNLNNSNSRKRDVLVVNQVNAVPIEAAPMKQPLKEKEKKAFGPGARDYKQTKPLDQQPLQVEKQAKIVLLQAGKKQKDGTESNNSGISKDGPNRNERLSLLNEWSHEIIKEKPTHDNKSSIIHNDVIAVDNGGGIGGGYLVEFNKRRKESQRQRSASNPRGRMRVDPLVDPQQYTDDSSTVRSDGRLLSQRQREHQQQLQQMEETLSLPTILPNRQLKSSQYAESSDIVSKGLFFVKSERGHGVSNRNTTMSAPPKMMMDAPPSSVPLVLPSISNKKSLLSHDDATGSQTRCALPLLIHPSSKYVDQKGGDSVVYSRNNKRG